MEFDVQLNSESRPSLTAQAALNAQSTLIGVTGPSGAGKTTLLRALAGLETDAQVSVRWCSHLTPRVLMVFREPCLFPHLSALQNLELARRYSPVPNAGIHTFAELCRCDHLLTRSVQSLSAGEAQRIALARALASQPDVLLIDEGMGAIDSKTRRAILSDLYHYARANTMRLLVVSHDIDDLALYADELVLLKSGALAVAGAVAKVLSYYANETAGTTCLSLLEGQAVEPDPRYPYHRFVCEGQTLYAHKRVSHTDTVRLVVDARQVSLDTLAENQSTLVNAFPCSIVDITGVNDAESKVTLKRGATSLHAIISQLSLDRLSLEPGQDVIARFKLC